MRRIGLAVILALGLALAPLATDAEQIGRVPKVGFLGNDPFIRVFDQGLRELGYTDGQNISIEQISFAGRVEALPTLAAELVRRKVDLLVASTTPAALAARNATTTIPIVMVNVADPVASGLVVSLARPGGNVTGLSRVSLDLIGKNLELLREAAPAVTRLAVLVNPTHALLPALLNSAKHTAALLTLKLEPVEAAVPKELERAFSVIASKRVNALLVLPDGMFWGERRRIADFALRSRLPSMFGNTEHAEEAGGLMSYAPSSFEPYRRAAYYVDKILKGAKPADLPVEQPTKFELVINLKTAKALGLTIPQSLLLRADQVIE
jgi:putative tryptophan/tyrosine transport system substrate-binding protein